MLHTLCTHRIEIFLAIVASLFIVSFGENNTYSHSPYFPFIPVYLVLSFAHGTTKSVVSDIQASTLTGEQYIEGKYSICLNPATMLAFLMACATVRLVFLCTMGTLSTPEPANAPRMMDYLTNNCGLIHTFTTVSVLAEAIWAYHHLRNKVSVPHQAKFRIFTNFLILQSAMLSTFVALTLVQYVRTSVWVQAIWHQVCIEADADVLIANALVHTLPSLIFPAMLYYRTWFNPVAYPNCMTTWRQYVPNVICFVVLLLFYKQYAEWECTYNLKINDEKGCKSIWTGEYILEAIAFKAIGIGLAFTIVLLPHAHSRCHGAQRYSKCIIWVVVSVIGTLTILRSCTRLTPQHKL